MRSPTEFIAEADAVVLDLEASSAEDAISLLHKRLAERPAVLLDAERFLADVKTRMRMASVCIADDIALPHARTDAVNRLVLAVARTRTPVPFDPRHPAIQLIFLIGTPKAAVTEYLQVVARLSRLLRNPSRRNGLLTTENEADFRALLSGGVAACK